MSLSEDEGIRLSVSESKMEWGLKALEEKEEEKERTKREKGEKVTRARKPISIEEPSKKVTYKVKKVEPKPKEEFTCKVMGRGQKSPH